MLSDYAQYESSSRQTLGMGDRIQFIPDQTDSCQFYLDQTGSSGLPYYDPGLVIPVCKPKPKKGEKVKMCDPKFWDLSLMKLIGKQPLELVENMDSFDTLPPAVDPYSIPVDILNEAMSTCLGKRHRFATTVFRHICTIREAIPKNVTACPIKLDALEKVCFSYFPAPPPEREKEWRVVTNALHKAVWYARKYIRNFLDTSEINQYIS